MLYISHKERTLCTVPLLDLDIAGAGEGTQGIKVPAATPGNLGSIPRTHMVEEETSSKLNTHTHTMYEQKNGELGKVDSRRVQEGHMGRIQLHSVL